MGEFSLKDTGRPGKSRYRNEHPDKFPFEAFNCSKKSDNPRILSLISSWQLYNAIPSLGDSDISATNVTLSLTTPNAQAVGYKFRVSWYDGDGSNAFSFTDVASITINGIAASEWVGEGSGYLDLIKTATDTFQTLNTGIWDNSKDKFTGTWSKSCIGEIVGEILTSQSVAVTTATGALYYGDGAAITMDLTVATNYAATLIPSASAVSTILLSSNTTSVTFRYFYTLSATTNRTGVCTFSARWTTLYPRVS